MSHVDPLEQFFALALRRPFANYAATRFLKTQKLQLLCNPTHGLTPRSHDYNSKQ